MAQRLWHSTRQGLTRARWQLAGLTALLLVLACVLVVPQWLVRWELGAQAHALTAADNAKAINDVRTTLLQGIAGTVLLLGAYFTYRLAADRPRPTPDRPGGPDHGAVQPCDRAAR